ncbi:hypothetical protein PV325_012997 [Microctonus aethiopoides]|nr:hypothetical protein PV325_012997 [Microctonus aethiopoides]
MRLRHEEESREVEIGSDESSRNRRHCSSDSSSSSSSSSRSSQAIEDSGRKRSKETCALVEARYRINVNDESTRDEARARQRTRGGTLFPIMLVLNDPLEYYGDARDVVR